jgi:hypothetical protein
MDKNFLVKLTKLLEGLDWIILMGSSLEIYTNGKRKSGDVDIALKEKDLDKLAERLKTKAEHRVIDKGTFVVDDYGFVVNFEGKEIEATNGYPKKRVSEGTFDKLFKWKSNINYLGVELFVAPIEEIIVQKAFMEREKDIIDLKLILSEVNFDVNRVNELAEDCGVSEKVDSVLKNLNFSKD